MEMALINTAMEAIGLPHLSRETLLSVAQSESEPKCNKPMTPTICRSFPVENPQFRRDLFRLDEAHHPKIEKLAKAGEWFVRACSHNNAKDGRTLMVSGDPGVGKTHVMRAIYRYIQSFGVDICYLHSGKHPLPLWLDWPRIVELERQDQFDDVLYEVERSRVIFVDDIGSESDRFRSGIGASRLRVLLSRTESKWMMATTNLSKPALFETYDARVADRFKAFRWLSLSDVPSYRGKLKDKFNQQAA